MLWNCPKIKYCVAPLSHLCRTCFLCHPVFETKYLEKKITLNKIGVLGLRIDPGSMRICTQIKSTSCATPWKKLRPERANGIFRRTSKIGPSASEKTRSEVGGEIFEYVLSSIDMVLSTSVYSVCVRYTMAELQGLETRVFRKRNMVRKGLLPTNPQPLVVSQ